MGNRDSLFIIFLESNIYNCVLLYITYFQIYLSRNFTFTNVCLINRYLYNTQHVYLYQSCILLQYVSIIINTCISLKLLHFSVIKHCEQCNEFKYYNCFLRAIITKFHFLLYKIVLYRCISKLYKCISKYNILYIQIYILSNFIQRRHKNAFKEFMQSERLYSIYNIKMINLDRFAIYF